MTPINDDTRSIDICQDDFQAMLREQVRLAVRCTLVTILNEEVDAFIGAGRYERTAQRRDQRNGTYPRSLGTSVGQIDDLHSPRLDVFPDQRRHASLTHPRHQRRMSTERREDDGRVERRPSGRDVRT